MSEVVIPNVVLDKPISIDELTTATVDGTGVFDVMMRAVKSHLEAEFRAQRIRGADYANVYLGSLTAVLGQSNAYALSRVRLGLELEQLKAQTALIETQRLQVEAETINADAQRQLILAQVDQIKEEIKKSPYQIAILTGQATQQTAQTALTNKQVEQVTEEIKKVPVEVSLLTAQVTQAGAQLGLTNAQTEAVELENLRAPKQLELLGAQLDQAVAQTALTKEQLSQIKADVARTTQETSNLVKQADSIIAQTAQTTAQTDLVIANTGKVPHEIAGIEAQNILTTKQGLKLDKDIALQVVQLDIQAQNLEIAREELKLKANQLLLAKAQLENQKYQTELTAQKVITERAQTDATVIGEKSVLGLSNALLAAQIRGFQRDAEQKLAKMLIDTWSVRRSNDDAVVADQINKLDDATIGAAVQIAINGISATA